MLDAPSISSSSIYHPNNILQKVHVTEGIHISINTAGIGLLEPFLLLTDETEVTTRPTNQLQDSIYCTHYYLYRRKNLKCMQNEQVLSLI